MKIVFLGSGNVATHLALAFKGAGHQIIQVWSKTKAHAARLAAGLDAEALNDLSDLDRSADLYLISIKDEAISELATSLKGLHGVVAHTSGATSIHALQDLSAHGVFYPLQTFSKDKALDLSNTPICLEASSAKVMDVLKLAAQSISEVSFEVDSPRRKILHLAAVFACNFTNHLYQMSYSILEQHGLDFNLLKPLILETASKVQNEVPFKVQTGPAIRQDEGTMARHLALLDDRPELQDIYITLSNSIKKTHL
jgi:predicted short-subunit dehydrogenase-like oxidoreductase (DUF2520 family)